MAIAAAWRIVAPVQLGGGISFVTTQGTSMLPHFRADGVVITRAHADYDVGEVVAYHNEQLHNVVMHRIVAIHDGRYVFKGDNNNFQDGSHAAKSQLIGEEWLYLPNAGTYLSYLRRPAVFAVLMALLGLFVGRAFVPNEVQRRSRHHAA